MWYMIIALFFCFFLGGVVGFEMGKQFGIQSVAQYTANLIMAQKVENLVEFLEFIESMGKEVESKD